MLYCYLASFSMKKWIVTLGIAMLFAACSSILTSKPSGTLSEEQMTDLLVEIHLTEATLRLANDSIAKLNDTTDIRMRFGQVFRKYDVKPDAFNSSLNYYIEHIDQLDKIYIEVIARLTEMEATLKQKTDVAKSFNFLNPASAQQNSINNKNPWFRTLNKVSEPVEIQYFDPVKYPSQQLK